MNNKISVIIPVYNVSAYLRECLDSILLQDYSNLEIILINDGSKDDSGTICDEYAARDSRFCVIHQANAGAGAAKNAGLRAATGDYLTFLDSDDYLEPGAYSHMVHLMSEHGADIVQCAFRRVFRDHTEDDISHSGRGVEGTEAALLHFTEDWVSALLWNKLYKRHLFNNIFFEEGHLIDDEFFTYQGVMNANSVVYDDRIIYNYRMRKSSVMHLSDRGKQKLMDRLDYRSKRRDHVVKRFPQLRKVYNSDYLDGLIALSRDAYNTQESIACIKSKLKSYFADENRTVAGISSWPSLLRLYVCSVNTLLRYCKKPEEPEDQEMLFY